MLGNKIYRTLRLLFSLGYWRARWAAPRETAAVGAVTAGGGAWAPGDAWRAVLVGVFSSSCCPLSWLLAYMSPVVILIL